MTAIVPPRPGGTATASDAVAEIERHALAELEAAPTPAELRTLAVRHVHELAQQLAAATARADRAAAELAERDGDVLRRERALAHLAADSRDESVPLGIAVTRSGWTRTLLGADGAIVCAEGRVTTVGEVPDDDGVAALLAWVLDNGAEMVAADDLAASVPAVAAAAPGVLAALGITLPDRQALIWLRHRAPAAWSERHADDAAALRGHLLEALYVRGRRELRATEALQLSLLPHQLPDVDGWCVEARYDAAGTGLVGGDWYDALALPSGLVALVVGDVTGHGLQAAATMGQLRNALRAALFTVSDLSAAVERLEQLARLTLPGEIATIVVALLDPATGVVEHVLLGHPPVLVAGPCGQVAWGPRAVVPPLGVTGDIPPVARVEVPRGGALVLYSDGLVERRGESILDGLRRLELTFAAGVPADLGVVVKGTRDPASADDATLLVVRREP
ncbi:PP2C family protein-serine/threonine phosphatase [Xylanimonas sp. McL0601]|uniref:PP2C family protein-serine/threonine phosphatase n=1 Tax=Xylanimonas sp. McL0601 TaxID=3414739 RepID=UPI003CF31449